MSRTGRPREFDRDEALQRAMELFWAKGYEGTTLADLLHQHCRRYGHSGQRRSIAKSLERHRQICNGGLG
jgi:hypothetical protein